jgi:DNA-binding CsgD family transcriptional regulator
MATATDEITGGVNLRPIERTVLKLSRRGISEADIAWRLRRTPGYVRRTLALARMPRASRSKASREPWDLRPIERTVLRARENGVPEAEMAARLRRSPSFVQRVAGFADYKLAQVSKGTSE